MTTWIAVDRNAIERNIKNGTNDPPLVIRNESNLNGVPILAHSVEILGPSKLVYSPHTDLVCHARLALVTEAEVKW